MNKAFATATAKKAFTYNLLTTTDTDDLEGDIEHIGAGTVVRVGDQIAADNLSFD